MAADWLLPLGLAVIIGLLKCTFDDSLLIPKTIRAHFSFNCWGNPTKLMIILIFASFLDGSQTLFRKIWLDYIQQLINFFKLFLCQRGASIAIFAATAFAFIKVTHKLLLHYHVAYQNVINRNHRSDFMQKYLLHF